MTTSFTRTRPRNHKRRWGVVLVAVLVCMMLAAALFVAILGGAAARHRQIQQRQLEMQAVWLTEAGVERAAARLASDADFTGDTWHIAAEQLGGRHDGMVRTLVQRDATLPDRYLVTVNADYPNDPVNRVRNSKTININNSRLEQATDDNS